MMKPENVVTRRRGVLLLSNATYLTTALGIISSPILARALGPVGRGEVAGATSYALFTSAVLALGFPSAVAHFAGSKRFNTRELLGSILLYCATLTPIAVLASLLGVLGPLAEFSGSGHFAVRILILMAPVYVLQLSLQCLLIANGSLVSMSKVQLLNAFLSTLGVVALAGASTLTTRSYAALYAGVTAMSAFATWRYIGLKPKFRSPLRPLVSFSVKAAPAGLANFTSLRLDQILIAPLLGARSLGIYAVAASIAAIPNTLGYAIAVGSYQAVASGSVIGRDEGLTQAARSLRLCLAGTSVLAIMVGVPAALVLPFLFGEDFRDSVIPLVILLPGSVTLAMSLTAHSALTAMGRPLLTSAGESVGLLVTVGGLLLFVRKYGVVAAATVSTVAYTCTMTTFLVGLHRMGARGFLPRRQDFTGQLSWLFARIMSGLRRD